MESMDYWRLCDELNIIQAALLIVGYDPGQEQDYVENSSAGNKPEGYEAVKTALINALKNKKIQGNLIPLTDYDTNGNPCGYLDNTTDIKESQLVVDSLRNWLMSRGIRTGFFFPMATEGPEYLDPNHPRYTPKLAAAVLAWQATTDTMGKTPKQAIEKWLREHASDFGLLKEDGTHNESAISELSKIANWQPGGGAPKTPVSNPPTPKDNPPTYNKYNSNNDLTDDEDFESIPF